MVYYTPSQSPWLASEAGRSPLVFLHGFGGGSSAYEWSQVYPAFADGYRAIAPDLLGWGRSEHPARAYRAEDYINTILEFLDGLAAGAIPVVASSLTAAFVVRAAVHRPDQFASLVLVAPSGLADFGQDARDWLAQLAAVPGLDRGLYTTAIATDAGIRNFLETRQFARPERVSPAMVEAYLQSAQQPNAEYAALAFLRGDLSFDLARYMGQLRVPTAILWGEQSQLTTPQLGKQLAELNPQAVRGFQTIADAGLTPQLETPAVAIALIQRYSRQLAAHS
ncbi:MAG: alpha/beta hydrolase [Cyanobacteria bacterium QS_8_64_29]|nr:MAG: alpha/beta hydrolase [Cyanobacteria bacterium QS_8_64_29]